MGKPLKGPSTTDMWSDDYPPKIRKERWDMARDTLYESEDKNLTEMAKCMNIAQQYYLELKTTVAQKGRVFAELFLRFQGIEVDGKPKNNLNNGIIRYIEEGGTKKTNTTWKHSRR